MMRIIRSNLRGMLMVLMMLMWMLMGMMMDGSLCLIKTSTWKVNSRWNIRRLLPRQSVVLHPQYYTPLWCNHPNISRQ